MNAVEYHTRLTKLFGQFRAIGTNYNQVVKLLYANFSEQKAYAYIQKLVKQTYELVLINQKIIQLTEEFEKKYLNKE